MAARHKPQSSPYDRTMGFRMIAASDGAATYEANVDEALHNPKGVLHGGVLAGLADAAMGAAFLSTLSKDERGTNVDVHIRFLRGTVAGQLRAEARVRRRGRSTATVECVVKEKGEEVAVASSTFLVLRRED